MNKDALIKECSECKLKQESKKQLCHVCITQKTIRGKWKLVIIWLLRDDRKRFSQLERMIPDITQSYLTRQLRELEQSGLVKRKIYNVIPPKVEYSLTEKGNSFLEVMEVMEEWGQKYLQEILSEV
ncbi:winged helix-turn-helix transcriptional regulator [Acetobacterium sp.]|uniref:winged helix-turn-helix transcriptional regulator n=1 Tax=Acetobacterium sp. TaxID=1872094 RepID=UPI003593E31B